MARKQRILLTGASGRIGRGFTRLYGDRYAMRLAYNTHPIEAPPGHEAVQMDLADYASVRAAMAGVEAVVHMGADTRGRAPWESVLPNNIIGTYNAFEAARDAGVARLIYASSNHAAGYAVREHGIPISGNPIRPDSLYGVSKCFGESLGRYYHDHYGMAVICLRIGSCHEQEDPEVERERLRAQRQRVNSFPYSGEEHLSMWISNRDMAQLIHCSLATECQFGIFYGESDNDPIMFDLTETREVLGYQPQDSVAKYLG